MRTQTYILCILMLVVGCGQSFAQAADSMRKKPVSMRTFETAHVKVKNFIIPAAFITYGVVASQKGLLRNIDTLLKTSVVKNHAPFKTHIEDYLQYSPAAAVFALSGLGVQGQHNIKEQALLYAMSFAISSGFVVTVKHISVKQRPDGSGNESFPSGHTANAFAAAEFLRREYKDVNPWIGMAGYVAATGTGILRVLNNEHWLSDVVAGAGAGIGATTISYWVYDKIKRRKGKVSGSVFMPYYNDKTIGLMFVKNLH